MLLSQLKLIFYNFMDFRTIQALWKSWDWRKNLVHSQIFLLAYNVEDEVSENFS